MTLKLDLPRSAEQILQEAWGRDLGCAVLEALAIEGYRTDKLSLYQVRVLLGHESRWETEAWLGSRGVHMNYTLEDLEEDRRTLDRLLGPVQAPPSNEPPPELPEQ